MFMTSPSLNSPIISGYSRRTKAATSQSHLMAMVWTSDATLLLTAFARGKLLVIWLLMTAMASSGEPALRLAFLPSEARSHL
jgi:hypothetical protein